MNFFSEVEKTIEHAFRKWTARAFGPADSDELLLVHRGILEEIKGKIQIIQRGQKLFPYNYLRVKLVSPDPGRRAVFQAAFAQDRRLESEIRASLEGAGCTVPGGFTVDIETAAEGPKGFEIAYAIREVPAVPVAAAPPESPVTPAQLVVTRGKAAHDSYTLDKPRTNIGRIEDLSDSQQRIVRRNDVVFEEGADEANATVSRGHAHITFDRAAHQYRICDDESEYGTRIFREGRSIAVPAGNRRGERLCPGDEIYLGKACLRFEL
ncbi:MAG: FHA domain-containing protein [Bryobacteraceae bacterium]